MQHLPTLIQDLGLILITAAIVAVVFKKLKQPLVLGYLVAGFLVSPNFGWFPTVQDRTNVSTWAEIGVIFMLFSLGLEFSFKKLKAIGKTAGITAGFEILLMMTLGYGAGRLLGWDRIDSLFLGGIISISSTTIIVRTFEELNLKGRNFISLVLGVLVIEDVIAILLLVLLSSVALTQTVSGTQLFFSSAKLIFFLALWFVCGIYLVPLFLKRIKDQINDEILIIVSLGLCLLMVIVATEVGFSPALGAFVTGSVLAETAKGKHIEHLILPIRSLFSAVFLVSVGMMLNFSIIAENGSTIALLVVLVIFGKFFGVGFGAVLAGKSIRHAVQSSLSMTQIGEFSFIIATLGMSLKVTSDSLYPIAVTVSVLTAFTTPYLVKSSEGIFRFIDYRLPKKLKESLRNYEMAMANPVDDRLHHLLWNEYGLKIAINAVMIVGVTLAASRIAYPKFKPHFVDFPISANFVFAGLVILTCMPFFWAIIVGKKTLSKAYDIQTMDFLKRIQVGLSVFRILLGSALVVFVFRQFTNIWAVSGLIFVLVAIAFVLIFTKYSAPIYIALENRFISNLNENDLALLKANPSPPKLAPWNATMVEITVSPNSSVVGKTLQESAIKEQFGITVAMIERGKNRILAPKRDDLVLPFDRVFVIGTDEQIASARGYLEKEKEVDLDPVDDSYGLISHLVHEKDFFAHQSIRHCGLREKVNGIIVGIERDGTRILNPDSRLHILPNDLLWLVGDLDLIKKLRE